MLETVVVLCSCSDSEAARRIANALVEKRLAAFTTLPALLVLVPPFLEDTGALGGILASRLSSKLHLGLIEPTPRPQRAAWADFRLIAIFAGFGAGLCKVPAAGRRSPGHALS